MNRLVAYKNVMRTWAQWVESNIDPTVNKVLFQGISPDHVNGKEWGEPMVKNWGGQSGRVGGSSYPGGPHLAEKILEEVLRSVSKPVHLLNVTTLSQLRKDGHLSVYGYGYRRDMDCSHWCLPGVPDTWNHLLYAHLLQA
ncbi:Trichome birefringence-like family [Trema orientale]|uniref:Trichome birefringence-like family n=1 Tax=Trema orientale TaxID=63057 RepID=A0A2P5FFE5_TREOI|nr:Trichome birefringence-like family [Trema orientale]